LVRSESADSGRVVGYTEAIANLLPLTARAAYAASRISSNLKGTTKQFGWLQASQSKFLLFQSLLQTLQPSEFVIFVVGVKGYRKFVSCSEIPLLRNYHRCVAPLDDLTHSGNLMNDEHLQERLRVSVSCLGFGG
jgi:hypothetical protein